MPFFHAQGRDLYYERHGAAPAVPASAPAVLFLHGAGSNAATWWQQLPAFTARFPCVTLDQRCFGRSVAPLSEFRHALFVADVLALLDHLKLPRVVLVGQSLGGMVSLRLALDHPQRVAAFVACDSPLGVDHPAIAEALEHRARTASAWTIEQRSLGAWFLAQHPERVALYAQINHFNPATYAESPQAWREAMARLTGAQALLPTDALRRLHCPTLWLVGSEDPLVPTVAMRDAQALAPDSELAVVADCGHSTYFEKPEVFNHLVLDFLARRLR
jgi:3-oxoadipate enol-lactonase